MSGDKDNVIQEEKEWQVGWRGNLGRGKGKGLC